MKFEHPLADDSGRLRLACCRSDTVQGTLAPMAPTEHKVASRIVIAKCTHAEGPRRCCGLTKKYVLCDHNLRGPVSLEWRRCCDNARAATDRYHLLADARVSTYSTRVTGK